jgi:hypothetical protein
MGDRYLTPGIEPKDMERAFRAAARLYRAAPWDVILTADSLLSVSSDGLGLRGAAVSIVGQHRTAFGFSLFPGGVDAYSAFERAAANVERGGTPTGPGYVSLLFVAPEDLARPMRNEITQHGWEIAGPSAYPLFQACDGHPLGRWPTRDELERLEAVALALAELVDVEPRLADATFGADSFDRAIEVETFRGSRSVRVVAPNVPPPLDADDEEEWAAAR